ncbi:sulfotransferase family protein [Tahibacter soli]|uniref:Sulfotransferase n=1 Tax=Tahibacter soli TaxID=2983605 RepID=A0A9X3YFP0_9GAMM|nr:sulfotransferase [Tahibacter soli]MDC8011094.1 sulfotransferase [Tahibacter soli]
MQVFVCGMHRSGTSMVARLLNLMGMYFGPEGSGLPVNRENPKGFWERRDVVELNDRLLAATDSVWYDVYGFLARDTGWRPPQGLVADLRAKLLDIDAYRPWFIKDPRLCLTLPYWLEHCERPVAVVCSRSPQAVVASLAKRAEITGVVFSVDEAVALWEAYGVALLRATRSLPCVFVRYDDVLATPETACAALFDALEAAGVTGLRRPSAAEVAAFVDAGLQRSGIASGRAAPALPERVAPIDALLQRGGAVPPLSRASLDALAGLHSRLWQVVQSRRVAAALTARAADIGAVLARDESAPSEPWSVARLRKLASTKSAK